ncbi:MAG: DUF488 domain-containing protein [Alicyclobacillaceae bacterium]|nr:DUF488 domain-containing protein [Alicyclobacillaceae bacterium]
MDKTIDQLPVVTIATIGFTRKSLRDFISSLRTADVSHVLDTRLHNTSQLSGFAKRSDLEYILEVHQISYTHDIQLAPTEDLLRVWQRRQCTWEEYADAYRNLLVERQVERLVHPLLQPDSAICLLCSEDKPHHCHRRVLAEYLQSMRGQVTVRHL